MCVLFRPSRVLVFPIWHFLPLYVSCKLTKYAYLIFTQSQKIQSDTHIHTFMLSLLFSDGFFSHHPNMNHLTYPSLLAQPCKFHASLEQYNSKTIALKQSIRKTIRKDRFFTLTLFKNEISLWIQPRKHHVSCGASARVLYCDF